MFKYTDSCTYSKAWDEYTRQARGIIFNKKTGECIARPFKKFFNAFSEMPESINLPDLPYEVYDKADGSLGISYIKDGDVKIATAGSFISTQAQEAMRMLNEKYSNFKEYMLHDNEITYLFEIIYPENKIVVDYKGERKLLLLGAINRITGYELPRYYLEQLSLAYDVPIVEKYELTIPEMIELQKTIPKDREGFIVRFSNGLRIKIKGQEYLRIHKIKDGITPLNIWESMVMGKVTHPVIQQIPEECIPDFVKIYDNLREKYENIYMEIHVECDDHFGDLLMKDELTKEDKRRVGLDIQKPDWFKHPQAMFPFLLHNEQILDKYIKSCIKPKANIL